MTMSIVRNFIHRTAHRLVMVLMVEMVPYLGPYSRYGNETKRYGVTRDACQVQHITLIAIIIGVVFVAGFTSLFIIITILAIITTTTIVIIVIPLPHLPVLPHALPR